METRKEHWEEALSLYLDNVREQRFEWGSHDCAGFAAGAIKAVAGTDISEEFAGTYSTWREAAHWLKERGYRCFKDAVSDRLGEPVHPAQAGRGDIVIRRSGNGNILGVCVGKYSWFLSDTVVVDSFGNEQTVPELFPFTTISCDAAWKIGAVKDEPLEDNSNG